MTNEEGCSSHSIHIEGTNTTKENEPNSLDNLLKCVNERNVTDNFSSIYEVPSRRRDVNPSAFTPRVVSIGPMHEGRANLKLMEDKKPTYLHELFNDLPVSQRENIMKECLETVSDAIEVIKGLYFGQFYDRCGYTDDKLAEMMVMDGCFILQFINKLSKFGDALEKNWLHSRSIAMDLVLLENQIPFFVLQDIYNLTFKKLERYEKTKLTTMLYELLERVNPFFEKLDIANLSKERSYSHILDVLHELYNPQFYLPEIKEIPMPHSAVELHEVGVRFKLNENASWLMDINFEPSSRKPIFGMPKVLIDNYFEVVMRNLIAYEQYSSPIENYVTSYAKAMYMLVTNSVDVAELAKSKVIVTTWAQTKMLQI